MTYLAEPAHYAPDEFRAFLQGLKFDKGWRPWFPTLHNTGVPSLAQWLAMGDGPQERWGSSLNAYYRRLGWHAGPHLVVCPDYVWNLCDLEADGVSVSCWNKVTLGIEMVGNFEIGGDDFATGPGARVRDNAVFALACLCEKFGWDIATTLHFHRECARDGHACPGSRVSKPEIIQRVNARLESWGAKPAPPAPDLSTTIGVQQALCALGYRLPVNGQYTAEMKAAVKAFQTHAGGLVVDGVVGDHTRAALRRELAGLARVSDL